MLDKHPLSKKYKSLLNKFNINTSLRLGHYFGQLQHESNLKPIEENLRYSEKRLLEVFDKYFNRQQAKLNAMNPSAIANRVYANRMGNGSEASGDGYKYRGRGYIQLTGKDNYANLTRWAQQNGIYADYVKNPDLLLQEADAMISSIWFWTANGINKYADQDDVLAVSRAVNLGNPNSKKTPNGYADRKAQTQKYKEIFSC